MSAIERYCPHQGKLILTETMARLMWESNVKGEAHRFTDYYKCNHCSGWHVTSGK